MSVEIFIALGTNLGNRLENLTRAVDALAPQVQVLAASPIYETAPWGYTDQPDFLNQVVRAITDLSPRSLLHHLKDIEARLGRKPTFRYGPRQVDLDILYYYELVLDEADLIIPHPRLHQRAFVLVPLRDIAPQFRHPVLQRTVQELLSDVDTSGVKPLAGIQE